PRCSRGRKGPRLTNQRARGHIRLVDGSSRRARATKTAAPMLLYEYKLKLSPAQQTAIDEALRAEVGCPSGGNQTSPGLSRAAGQWSADGELQKPPGLPMLRRSL